jgi:glycosyltransferase involved in cell wall biosynthesis
MAPASGALADELMARGIEHAPFEVRTSDGQRISQSRLRESLAEALARRSPALLHANSLAMSRLSGPVAAELRMPSMGHLRDIVRMSDQAIADMNCHRRLIAVSQATRDFHVAAGLDGEKTHVVYNGVDLQAFYPRAVTGSLHRELGLPGDAKLVGTIGQIGLRKGQDVLIRAAAALAERFPEVHSLIVGERHSQKEESRQFEESLHRASGAKVHFLGVRRDVDRWMNELTLLVHPARQEPLGRVLLEAAASGVAIVASDVGGTSEIFLPGSDAARLVPSDDPESLAEAMADLLRDASLRRRLGMAARKRVEEQFTIEQAVAGLMSHYRALIG